MEWSNELILEFFELYDQERYIYTLENPQYKIYNTVHDSWDNISKKPVIILKIHYKYTII